MLAFLLKIFYIKIVLFSIRKVLKESKYFGGRKTNFQGNEENANLCHSSMKLVFTTGYDKKNLKLFKPAQIETLFQRSNQTHMGHAWDNNVQNHGKKNEPIITNYYKIT